MRIPYPVLRAATARRLGSRGELRHMPVEEGSEEQLPLVMTHQKSESPTKVSPLLVYYLFA